MKYTPLIAILLLLPIFTVGGGESSIKTITPKIVSEDIFPYCWGLAVGHVFDNNLTILVGSSNRVVAIAPENGTILWQSQELSGNVRKITAGNVSGDERDEVLVATHDGHLYIIDALKNEVLLDWDKSHFTNGAIFGLCVEDIDGDGKNEIIVGTGTASIGVYIYNAGTLFVKGLTTTQDAVFETKIGDVNGDGKKDIVFVDWRGNTESSVRVLEYNFGQFTQKYISPYIPGILSALAVEDIDGDGVAEIVAGSGDGNVWFIKLTSSWEGEISTVFVAHAQIFGVAVGDFEGDGIKDVALTTWDGFVYLIDTQTKSVKYRSEKRPTDLGNSNSVLFFSMPNSSKECLAVAESGIPEILSGHVLIYATKNIEILSVEYSPKFPSSGQDVNFNIEILSVSANRWVEIELLQVWQGMNESIGTKKLNHTLPNTKYWLNFTWKATAPGYHTITLFCNAEGEVTNKTIILCVAVQIDIGIRIGSYLNKTLREGEQIAVKIPKGEVVDVVLSITNNAPYTLFNLTIDIWIENSTIMTKKFDISGIEQFYFKIDTFLITNDSFNLTIKSKLVNPIDNIESVYSTFVICVNLMQHSDYSSYLSYIVPSAILTAFAICLLWIIMVERRKYVRLFPRSVRHKGKE